MSLFCPGTNNFHFTTEVEQKTLLEADWQYFMKPVCFCVMSAGTVPSYQVTGSLILNQFTRLRNLEKMFIGVNWKCL